MIVVSAITANRSIFEELLHGVQHLHTPLSLYDREAWLDLPAETTRRIPEDRNTEAAFAVDKADDPLRETLGRPDQPVGPRMDFAATSRALPKFRRALSKEPWAPVQDSTFADPFHGREACLALRNPPAIARHCRPNP